MFEIFSDRMEFTSYGGLIQGQSEEDFFSCSSMSRNRELIRGFKDVGLVEQLGSGMSRILRFYDRDIFQISNHFIKVVFPFSPPKENMNIAIGDNNGDNGGDKNIILDILKKEPAFTAKELSEQTGFSARKISRLVKELRETGKIVRIGSARKGFWQVKLSIKLPSNFAHMTTYFFSLLPYGYNSFIYTLSQSNRLST